MSFVGDMLGLEGNKGASFNPSALTPQVTNSIQNPYSAASIQAQQVQQQNAINQAYQTSAQAAAQNGFQNQSQVYNQQQALANQLQGVANGTGPNPALQQLQNTTGQNVQTQAALMAGQRGAGSNAGLLARQIGQQGASTQQQAVGQGAALAAQQQLAGMNALQQQQQMLGNTAGQQVNQQLGANQAYNQATLGQQALQTQGLLGAQGQAVGLQENLNNVSGGIAQQTGQAQQDIFGGALGSIGPAATFFSNPATTTGNAANGAGKFQGGMIKQHYDQGGVVNPMSPQSFIGQYFVGDTENINPQSAGIVKPADSGKLKKGTGDFMKSAVSLGSTLAAGASRGGVIPGKGPVVAGDNPKNDIVPAMLSPKEIVIPRSITMGKNAPEKARDFVAAVLAKNGMRKK